MNPNVFKIPQLLVNVTIFFLMVLLHDAEPCTVKHMSLYNDYSHGYLHVANDSRGSVRTNSYCVYPLDIITFDMTSINETSNIMKMFIFDPFTRKFICTDPKNNRLVSRRRITKRNRRNCFFTYETVNTAFVKYRPLYSKRFISFNRLGTQQNSLKKKYKQNRKSMSFLDTEVSEHTQNICEYLKPAAKFGSGKGAASKRGASTAASQGALEMLRHQHRLCK